MDEHVWSIMPWPASFQSKELYAVQVDDCGHVCVYVCVNAVWVNVVTCTVVTCTVCVCVEVLTAELAQSVERTTLNRVVVGSIPTFGVF